MRVRPIEFEVTKDGCIVPLAHKLNRDGYFRKNIGNRKLVMYHRHVYEIMFGTIPEGYEVDHLCKHRACCNPEHLQAIEGSAHAIKSNQERYAKRHTEAYTYWISTGCTGTKLAEVFGVSFSIGCRWIRDWKRNV